MYTSEKELILYRDTSYRIDRYTRHSDNEWIANFLKRRHGNSSIIQAMYVVLRAIDIYNFHTNYLISPKMKLE